ncbi:MAG TPA: ester cyclase [Vicinamibacterales bacterium]|jgi:steroid delta-isomerase-like uncharacterized protein
MADKTTIVRRLFDDVWSKGNVKLLDEIVTTDYAHNDPMNDLQGPDAMKDLVKKYRSAFPDCRIDIDELLTAGDKVVARWRYSGTQTGQFEGMPPTGRHATGPGITIFRFQGDRVQESHSTWDALGMMQQLGVVTLPGKAARVSR